MAKWEGAWRGEEMADRTEDPWMYGLIKQWQYFMCMEELKLRNLTRCHLQYGAAV
jgi:hypothetical protein